MPLKRSISVILSILIVIMVAISSYFILNMIFATNFEIKSWDVIDNNGFPAISYEFSCSDYVIVKMFDSDSNLIDNDLFLAGQDTKNINLGTYKQTISKGDCLFKAYTKDGDEIYSKSFKFNGPDLSITSCDQKWWINGDETILIGLSFTVGNTGDVPAYPYSIELETDSESVSGLVLPTVINAGSLETIDCVLYKKDMPSSDNFFLKIKDIDNNIISSQTFSFDIKNSVSTRYFNDGVVSKLSVPYPDFLYDYYSNLERLTENDYSYLVFDIYDDFYIDLFVDRLISTLGFGEFQFNSKSDSEKINFIADFVQNLEYKEDVIIGDVSEYPNYPLETLFYRAMGCDCEDKSILMASLLDNLNFNVSLFRLPNHMAVGVNLPEGALPSRDYYYQDYYYLETTTEKAPVGFVPSQYRDSVSELGLYEITDKPYLIHQWIDNILTIYTNTEYGDFVKIDVIVENDGRINANNIDVEGVFVTTDGFELNSKTSSISSLEVGIKKKLTFTVDIPSITSTFETRIIYNGEVVNTKESSDNFN